LQRKCDRSDGQQGISKGYAINNHRGGYSGTSSEGCQTVYPDQWLQFQQMAYRAMDKYGLGRIGYLLVESVWLGSRLQWVAPIVMDIQGFALSCVDYVSVFLLCLIMDCTYRIQKK